MAATLQLQPTPHARPLPAPEAVMSGRVVVSFDEAIVAEVALTRPVTVIGRRPDCDIVLEHPAISGRHALLRLEERRVFVEDLASTNGVRVNGLPCSRQLVQHLDLIEIGRHKVHYFDDSLLSGRVSLESTVHSDYERTLVAPRGAEEPMGDAPMPTLTDIAARPLDGTQLLAVPAFAKAADFVLPPRDAPCLRLVEGPRKGERLALVQANTMVGTAGSDNALVVRRGANFYLARFSGAAPRLNGRAVGPGTHSIGEGDTIEVGALRYELVLQPESR